MESVHFPKTDPRFVDFYTVRLPAYANRSIY